MEGEGGGRKAFEYKGEDMRVEVLDVWFDKKGNPRVTVQYTHEQTVEMEVEDEN